MGQIYLVRHGQASFGQTNYDQLSPLGFEQARMLGRWFAQRGLHFHQVVTGSMQRHLQTAETCLAMAPDERHRAGAWQVDAGFNEYNHHDVLVRHWPAFEDAAEVRRFIAETPNGKRAFQSIFQDAVARWMSGAHDAEYAEAWPDFRTRCVASLTRLAGNAPPSQDIVVFTSGGTIATLCQQVLGLPDERTAALNWSLVNCAVTKLFYQPDRLALSYLNNYAHLEAAGDDDARMITYR
jgi:broad specificity phosphatase PhoE